MKKLIYILPLILGMILVSSCELEEIKNPNAPTYESFLDGATQADIHLLSTGLEAIMRNDLEFHYQTISIIGREYYDLTGVDPRFTQELLKGPLDNNGFLTTRAFAAWYKIVQTANTLEIAVTNSAAGFSNETKNGYYGYAKTLKAYALLMAASRQYTNGIRIDVSDPENLGPILDYQDALTEISSLLDEAYTDLSNAGAEFDFVLSSGFAGFDDPTTFGEFNQAVKARCEMYRGNKSDVLTALGNSFMDLNGGMYEGPSHVFGATGNDILNNLYYIPDQSGQEFMAHDTWVSDSEPLDDRVVDKVSLLAGGAHTFDGLTASYQVNIYKSNVDPVYIIRNEELILLYAEANIGTDNPEAESAINIIRNAAGLPDYSGGTADADLEDEVLHQRRYSLFGEGHRWVDLRRYGRLSDIPTDRVGDNVLDAFPTPVTEFN